MKRVSIELAMEGQEMAEQFRCPQPHPTTYKEVVRAFIAYILFVVVAYLLLLLLP
jgi:hypothetical protein